MKKDWKNERERNEANDAAVYARKGAEIARTYIPEDTAEYVILAAYPGADEVPQVVRLPFGKGGAHPS